MERTRNAGTFSTTAEALLTTRDVAALIRVHPKQVYRLMRRGLPALRVGDEWRFRREEVLRWTGAASHSEGGASRSERVGLIAANGDIVIDVLLRHLERRDDVLFGMVLADHDRGSGLLRSGRVVAAGCHAGIDPPPVEWSATEGPRQVRLHLVTREVGIASRHPLRRLGLLVGKRVATRPVTAGLRSRMDVALARVGVKPSDAYAYAVELGCHRDVTLAVARGDADAGLTTHAWAHAAKLSVLTIAEEDYELRFSADRMSDPRIVALCETAQTGAFRRDLRNSPGYSVSATGRIRF